MVNWTTAAALYKEQIIGGTSRPKTLKAVANYRDSVNKAISMGQPLDDVLSELNNIEVAIRSAALPIPATSVAVAQVVPLIPQREVPDVVDFKFAVGRQDLRAQLAMQISKANHDEWMANGCED